MQNWKRSFMICEIIIFSDREKGIMLMILKPIQRKDKQNRTVTLRSADVSDAEALLRYLKVTSGETPFLIREPDEIKLTLEQEEAFIRSKMQEPGELLLIGEIDGKQVGNCSVMSMGSFKRYAHRCEIAIALYQEYCGAGIGKMMMETVLQEAKKMGYEQAELEVVSDNANAIALYEKMGFKKYGTFPNSVKYSDGRYADAEFMMKTL